MRKLSLAAAGLLALVLSGLALAHGGGSTKSVKAVAGTFTATTVSRSQTRTCTTADGKSIATTNATYTGSASGDPDLSGPITLTVRSTINTTDGMGVLDGMLKIAAADGSTSAQLSAVFDHGNVAGLTSGRARTPRASLVGNVSAGFSTTGGFTSGRIGGGAAGGSAVELGPGQCSTAKSEKPVTETSESHGIVSALSPASITVGGLTCAVPANLVAQVSAAVKVGDTAEIKCSLVSGVNTLNRLSAKQKEK